MYRFERKKKKMPENIYPSPLGASGGVGIYLERVGRGDGVGMIGKKNPRAECKT